MIVLEICVDSAAGIEAARKGGADRIELCSALALGGLSPGHALMVLAARAGVPVMAMIRPRAGDFVWSDPEVEAMSAEIDAVRKVGLAGIVIGASRPDGRLDTRTLERLVATAAGLEITLHRAIDIAPDPIEALAICRDLGIGRVLSSGGAATAVDGLDRLVAMQKGSDVTIMPGGGVSVATLPALAARPATIEIHVSCAMPLPPPSDPRITEFGFRPRDARETDVTTVADLRRALDQL